MAYIVHIPVTVVSNIRLEFHINLFPLRNSVKCKDAKHLTDARSVFK